MIRVVVEKLGIQNIEPLEDLDRESSDEDDDDEDNKPCPSDIIDIAGNEF